MASVTGLVNAWKEGFAINYSSKIGEFLTSFQYYEKESGNCLGEPVKLELIRRDLRNYRELDGLFAVWKNDLHPDSKSLIERLENFDVERRCCTRDRPSTRAHQVAQNDTKPNAVKTCHYCNRKGHIRPECRTYLKDKESGNLKTNKTTKTPTIKGNKGKGKDRVGHAVIETTNCACENANGSWQWIAQPQESAPIEQRLALLVQEKLDSRCRSESTSKVITSPSFRSGGTSKATTNSDFR